MDARPPGGTRAERRRLTSDAAAVEAGPSSPDEVPGDGGLSPVVLAYVVGPVALVLVAVFWVFGLVAREPIWLYVVAVGATALLSALVERWRDAPSGSLRLHARIGLHVTAVTVIIYLSGWGPALGVAYVFVALEELEQCGSSRWRPVLLWSLATMGVAELLVWFHLAPSLMPRVDAAAVGALGAFLLVIVLRMAGATGDEKERAEARLAHQALHDTLTGLPNRACFYDRADALLSALYGEGSDPAAEQGLFATAVLLFDLDRFKEINDTLGHQCGDRILVHVGPRVRAVLRAGDLLARLGGDEFCVLLPEVDGQETAVRIARRLVRTLDEPIEVDGIDLAVEASCGIALAPRDGVTADQLLQRADVAMYEAKESTGGVVVYADEINVNTPDRLALLGDLRTALARDEFRLHFQPAARMDTGDVCGAEALIRWQHPSRGLLYPDRFIGDAERSGLIEPITEWVLDTALQQCRRWLDRSERTGQPALSVAVNLSTRSLLDASLPATVAAALDRWRVPGDLLELEITETVLMADPRRARRVLVDLAGMGVVLAIDDFGTGYSSLAYLRELPVTQLKIDRSFVSDMGSDADDAVIVRSVIDLARNLGLQTVAEGVEDDGTWATLRELGCAKAQGYVLAPPMSSGEFRGWFELRACSGSTAGQLGPTAARRGVRPTAAS